MITNINYLKTAVEVLEDGGQTPMTEAKILSTIAHICQQNIDRIQLELIDKVDQRLAAHSVDKASD